MKYLPVTRRPFLTTLALTLLLSACTAATPVTPPPSRPTSDQQSMAVAPTAPASTAEQLAEAERNVAAGNYDYALSLLHGIVARSANTEEVRNQLALAYRAYGLSLLETADGNPPLVREALDRFTNGLAYAPPDGELRADLEQQVVLAEHFLALVAQRDILTAQSTDLAQLATNRPSADQLSGTLRTLWAEQRGYPGLAQLYGSGMMAVAAVYEAMGNAEGQALALAVCEELLREGVTPVEATSCRDRLEAALRASTPTPVPTTAPAPTATPVPPAEPPRLRVVRLNQNDDPHCITLQVLGRQTTGWRFSIDGLRLAPGLLDGSGNARICGLGSRQEVTFSVLNGAGHRVPGGSVRARGGDIFRGDWQ